MSFRATIDSIPKQNAWYRGLYVLNTIDEKIKVTITEDEIILWAAHNTGSSCCQLSYNKIFFSQYEFKPNNVVFGEEGLQTVTDLHEVDHKLYSFEISAKSLGMVSKKSDNDEIKEYTIAIDNTTTCSDVLMNRLMVTVAMESLIVKDHALLFNPIKYTSNRLDLQYKRKFLDVYAGSMYENNEPNNPFDPALIALFNKIEYELSYSFFGKFTAHGSIRHKTGSQLNELDEINYISCNYVLIKNFIDNCNTSVVRDIKLQLFDRFLTITGSRNDLKNSSEILQHGIIISNTIDTNDLGPYCIYNMEEDTHEEVFTKKLENEKKRQGQSNPSKTIVFGLKDFKNFINIAMLWKNITSSPDGKNEGKKNNNNINNNNTNKEVGIWFCRPGEPILFQMARPEIQTQLLLLTDGSGTAIKQVINTNVNETRQNSVKKLSGSSQRVSPTRKRSRVDVNVLNSSRADIDNSRRPLNLNPLEIRDNRISPLKVARTPQIKRSSPSRDGRRPVYNSPRRLFVTGDSQESAHGPDLASAIIPSLSRTSSGLSATATTRSARAKALKPDIHQRERDAEQARLERSETTVGWGKTEPMSPSFRGLSRQSSMEEDEADRQRILRQEKMKYVRAAKDQHSMKGGNNRHRKEESITEEDELGPTQYVHVKGLFE